MIDFGLKQTEIKNYIEENFTKSLEAIGLDNVNYIDDFLDLDKYQKNNQLFYDFSNWDFSSLSNESNSATLHFNIYLTFRNGRVSALSDTMYKYAAAFYDMFHKSGDNFSGIFDYGIIENCKFYQAAEANVNVKVCAVSIRLVVED